MGQQQLLLLVLGIVIVGLAVVAGINAFAENQQKSSQDALTQEAFRLASDAKAWFQKPTQFGGAAGKTGGLTASAPTWADIGAVDTTGADYNTPWGTITRQNATNVLAFDLTTTNGSGVFGHVLFDPTKNGADQIQFSRGAYGSGGG